MMHFLHMTLFIVCALSSSHVKGQSSTVPTTSGKREEEEDPLKAHRIVCLYNHKQYYHQGHNASDIDPHPCTHLNYEFATLHHKKYVMEAGDETLDIHLNMFQSALDLRLRNPTLKVMLSLGGWEDSTKKYSELVESGARVDHFINEAVKMLKKHGFDGLDVAWEYPNCWQGALGVEPKDKKNYAEFLEKLRKRFDREDLILSISVGAIKREIEAAYDGPKVSKSVHHINVMTYDMHGPWESTTGHHTQMDKVEGDKDPYLNAKAAMQLWADMGVDKEKLNLGIATYAKTFTLANPSVHGLNAPAKGPGRPGYVTKQSGFLCYYEICQFLNAGNWTEDEHKSAGFYAYSGDQWACYDPPMMVVRKAKWVIENGYGGVLIKDMSCDDHEGLCYSMHYLLTKMTEMEMIHKLKRHSK